MNELRVVGPRTRKSYAERYSKNADAVSGLAACNQAYIEAEASSAALRERIEVMFLNFESKHRLLQGEARFLLLSTGIRERA